MNRRYAIALAFCAVASLPAFGSDPPLRLVRVIGGMSRPTFVGAPPGDTTRLFIVEGRGSGGVATRADIRILDLTTDPPTLKATPFLTISPVSTGFEQGLLCVAFHPSYATNGFFYVTFTDAAGTVVLRRYTRSTGDPNVADPSTAVQILAVSQPFSNHNGGWIGFGPDGYLYLSKGDGGGGCDPSNRAQDITDELRGKMLRLDVDGDDFPGDPARFYRIPPDNPFVGVTGDDEIWSYGLRNPWRCSFDRLTGDLWIGDVGQNTTEEIDFQPASSSGGENYGWDCKEGKSCSPCTPVGCVCTSPGLVDPIHDYAQGANGCSVTGGYVYRGCALPGLRGAYFFGDFCSSRTWSFRYDGVSITEFKLRLSEFSSSPPLNNPTSFGEDANGELYICDVDGDIFKIVRGTCRNCPLGGDPCDMDCNGTINPFDIQPFLGILSGGSRCSACAGDTDCNGSINPFDIQNFLDCLSACR